jgi:monoamine oxidase
MTAPVPGAARPIEHRQVAVIGAGLSGLVAALELTRRGVDDVVVLEAKDRVGGRMYSRTIAGVTVDGGASFVGPKQTALLELADELGVETYPVRPEGATILVIDGRRDLNRPESLADDERAQFRRLMRAVNDLASRIDLEEPWAGPLAQELDERSLRDWIGEQGVTSEAAFRLFDMSIFSVLGAVSARVSALWAAWYFAQGGGLRFLTGIEDGAQDAKFAGGAQTIAVRLAEHLGDRVRLDSPVRRVTVVDDGTAVVDCGERQISTSRVIVACTPAETSKIAFSPGLPEARQRLNQGWVMSGGYKPFLAYERAFWRDAGLSGYVVSDTAMGTVMDGGPASGTPGILLAFTDPSALPSSPEGRRDAIAADLATVLGEQALEVMDYVETPWEDDPWISGCVSPLPPGVVAASWATMNDPVGPVHWAGTETARLGAGYMDGAVRAGRRAAAEVAEMLASGLPSDRPSA